MLAPSAAERWLHCPRSVHFTRGMQDTPSTYAEAGTLAHAIGELMLRKKYTEPGMSTRTYNSRMKKLKQAELYDPSMDKALEAYVDLVDRVVLGYPAKPHVALERALDLSSWAPESFGTADCIVVGGGVLHVIDYKNGQGVPVEAEGNPQLRLYGLGALREYGWLYPIDRVVLHICQSNLGNITQEEVTAQELTAWGQEIQPIARFAFEGKGAFQAGDWCRFCLARKVCRTRAEAQLAMEGISGRDPMVEADTLSPEEIGNALTRGRNLARWLKDVEAYAMQACLEGKDIPGWKVVEGRSNRAFADVEKAFEAALQAGVDRAMLYKETPETLTGLEKAMKKAEFEKVFGPYVVKPPGKPALAPTTDSRPPYTGKPSAQDDFAN